MCQFFSLISDGKGNAKYFDADQRKQIESGKLTGLHGHRFSPDSHSSIEEHYGMDRYNAYEYNPFTRVFRIDQHNSYLSDDSRRIRTFCENLDFDTIVSGFNRTIKLPVRPRKARQRASKNDLLLLKDYVLHRFGFSIPSIVNIRKKLNNTLHKMNNNFARALIKSLLFPKRQVVAVKAANTLYVQGFTVVEYWGWNHNYTKWIQTWQLRNRTKIELGQHSRV